MSSITTINSGDLISGSRTDINNNFANLNSDKIETSYLDTDTTLAANSDVKIATQKAVKAYVDAGGNVNASETTKGIVEEATDAEVTAGTATGGTGAKLFVTPAKLATRNTTLLAPFSTAKQYTVGALDNALVKTYFNTQLLFTLWTGSTSGALTTDYTNWNRNNATDVVVTRMGMMADFQSTGAGSLWLEYPIFNIAAGDALGYDNTGYNMVLDFFAKLNATGTGDINMGFLSNQTIAELAYNSSAEGRVCFSLSAAGVLYATIARGGTGVTNTDISSGITHTNWNHYRIELDTGSEARFYVNGVLKATLSGSNLPNNADAAGVGFGRSNTALFQVTAPNFALKLI